MPQPNRLEVTPQASLARWISVIVAVLSAWLVLAWCIVEVFVGLL
jgi:hypothetical protein